MPGWPGYISDSKSDFDGARVINIHPGAVTGCCSIGATWSEKYPAVVQLDAVVHGEYFSISSLELNANGRTIAAVPTVGLTKFSNPGGIRRSEKSFSIGRKDFEAIVGAQQLGVRLGTSGGAREGDLMRDAISGSAVDGFRNFAKRLP